jgi:hypothetical protein
MSKFTQVLTKLMILGALGVAVLLAWKHGMDKGLGTEMKIAYVVGLVVVAITEYIAWHNAACNWFERRAGSVLLWGMVGIGLTAGTLYTNFSSGAGNNDSRAGVQLSALTHQKDLASSISTTEREIARLEDRVKLAPVRTPEAARAAQEQAKAHRFWGMTKGCTETKGPQTRAHCDAFASAVADESMATQALVDRQELAAAKKELDALYNERKTTKVVVGQDQPQIVLLTHVANVDLDTARQADAMALPLLMQIVILFGGLATAAEAYRHQTRRPWVDVGKWVSRARLAWSGMHAHQAVKIEQPAALVPRLVETPAREPVTLHKTFTDRAFARTASDVLAQFRPKHSGQAA